MVKIFIHFVFMIKLQGNSSEIIIIYNHKDHFSISISIMIMLLMKISLLTLQVKL